jgi:RimJ/RimL family protein N-acetyltransferase
VAFAAKEQGEEDPCAIVVFQHFAGREAEVHVVTIGRKMTQRLLDAYLKLAFHPNFMGLKKCYAPIRESNIIAQRFCLAAGFTFEFRKRGGAAGGEDAIVMSITPDSKGLAAAKGLTKTQHQV